jgi:hypothetical protein
MPKIFIKFRKNFLLPIKWYFRRRQEEGSIVTPSNEELLLKYENIKDELLIAERTNDYAGIKIANSRLRLINWIIGKQ